ncbi:MAG: lipoprotein signal peptidase [Betaproteobacteria bacterium]|nr:lipoprotein signal peptidase [Betaproteobacteria bacterium]
MLKWLVLAGAILVVDQLTKFAITSSFALHEVVPVTPFFNLVLVYNPGAAFSFLADAAGWQKGLFIAIALVASVWIVYLLRKHAQQTLFCWALSLVLAGALGNVIDRVQFGAVIDFLDFHAFGWHWPAFNVADAAITCGAALLIFDGFRPRKTDSLEPPINADKRR